MRTKLNPLASKRGDTIIEVMFAIAVFSLVAVITVSMMNLGTANAEGSLELTTARHELNAQAEALRFVHSAYTAELALPECKNETGVIDAEEKCQQYKDLWTAITQRAATPDENNKAQQAIINITDTLNNNDSSLQDTFGKVTGCERAYMTTRTFGGKSLLVDNNAFMLNTRDLSLSADDRSDDARTTRALVLAGNDSVSTDPDSPDVNVKFTPTYLGARVIYAQNADSLTQTTDDGYAVRNRYSQLSRAEGIWVVAIKGRSTDPSNPPFYDFYIQTCWNAPNSLAPTILDTVIRLYNPGVKS